MISPALWRLVAVVGSSAHGLADGGLGWETPQGATISFGAAVTAVSERLVDPVQGMHRAISGRWFSALGVAGEPLRHAHDLATDTVYGVVRIGLTAIGLGIDLAAPGKRPSTGTAQSVVNGLWGDSLEHHEQRLAITMGVRDRQGNLVDLTTNAGIPHATGRPVILVHGWAETERCWQRSGDAPALLERLDDDPGLTAVAVRYNTGLRVSDNGTHLAELLDGLVRRWPVPIESIALVGHSMGGLVIRSACEAGIDSGSEWVSLVSDVVTLGTPHRGSPIEKAVNVAAWGLRFAPETRPLAHYLNGRSGGVKDLRFGAITRSDWAASEADTTFRDPVGDHPLPAWIDHHFVAGVFTSDPRNPLGLLSGDLVVRAGSGTGRVGSTPTNVELIGGVGHSELASSPVVLDRVMTWLTSKPARHGPQAPARTGPA
jgi:pimeloyl-ACP methyl ester carboxylesterase